MYKLSIPSAGVFRPTVINSTGQLLLITVGRNTLAEGIGLYSSTRPASTPPPFFSASAPKFQIWYTHPISLGCYQLYIAVVAKPVCSVARTFAISVIFVKYREVSTSTILLNFIGKLQRQRCIRVL